MKKIYLTVTGLPRCSVVHLHYSGHNWHFRSVNLGANVGIYPAVYTYPKTIWNKRFSEPFIRLIPLAFICLKVIHCPIVLPSILWIWLVLESFPPIDHEIFPFYCPNYLFAEIGPFNITQLCHLDFFCLKLGKNLTLVEALQGYQKYDLISNILWIIHLSNEIESFHFKHISTKFIK